MFDLTPQICVEPQEISHTQVAESVREAEPIAYLLADADALPYQTLGSPSETGE